MGHEPRLSRAAAVADALGFEFRFGPARGRRPSREPGRESAPHWAAQLRAALESHTTTLREEIARLGAVGQEAPSAPEGEYLSVPFVAGISVTGDAGRLECRELSGARLSVPVRGIPSTIESSRGLLCLLAAGDAMGPEFKDGDAILFDSAQVAPVDGGVFAVYAQNRLQVRRVVRSEGSWLLARDHPEKERRVVELDGDTVRLLGRVVWSGSLGLPSSA